MMEPVEERRTPITPQLALRVAILGGVAFALFAIVFFRLWYLQVLSGDEYLAQATTNRVRELRIQAPRGKIVDRGGNIIVRNRRAVVVEIDPATLPDSERDLALEWGRRAGEREARPKGKRGEPIPIPDVRSARLQVRYRRLAGVLDMSSREVHRRVVRSLVLLPYSDVRVKTDVPESVLAYISERPEQFPGVDVEETYVRDYPRGTLAAQILGTVGEISPKQLKRREYRGLKQGALVGQEGLERSYDRYLRGVDGIKRIQVDAFGRPIANDRLRDVDPIAGQRLRLSLDLALERTGQEALARIGGGRPGAFVALDPANGEVVALGSHPTFDPEELTKPITQKRYDLLFGEEANAPRFNRAIAGQYPMASTFKPITALAALDRGLIDPLTPVADPGCIQVGEMERCNAREQAYGSVTMADALKVSSDVYFYKLGMSAFYRGNMLIQRWARKLGFDKPTGIDLPGEFDGVIPDTKWRKDINALEVACRKKEGIPIEVNVFVAGASGCGYSDLREYNLGDNVNLAVGQGDVQATPLQLAVAYAAIANGGRVVTPHLGLEIESAGGELIQRIETDPARKIDIPEQHRAAITNGLRLAASAPGGTSTDVFADWDHERYPLYGKTGTAERAPKRDQSWYAAYVPDAKRPLVVVVTVEEGGFGAETAAPIACRILAKFYGVQAPCAAGSSFAR